MWDPSAWSWVEKASIITLLVANILALVGIARFAFNMILGKKIVPGWAYDDLARERDELRIENKALLGVTLRAIKVTDRAVGPLEA
jgi:hypothetical protein